MKRHVGTGLVVGSVMGILLAVCATSADRRNYVTPAPEEATFSLNDGGAHGEVADFGAGTPWKAITVHPEQIFEET
jgi:hypothetical protein